MPQYFLSICIPSYNRVDELMRLLRSVDCSTAMGIQIVVCEDRAPKREAIAAAVRDFTLSSAYDVKFIENPANFGYDRNLRELVLHAEGEFIIYMGDDDLFIEGELDEYILFLMRNQHLGYVLRSYVNTTRGGREERYQYYSTSRFFAPGPNAYVELYRKSVFISGFTFKRVLALPILTDRFDGSLLFQLYLLAEICLKHASAYYSIPFVQSIDEGLPFYFGVSEVEESFRTPGETTLAGETRFIASFLDISAYLDSKYGIESTAAVLRDMSKYSYPILAHFKRNGPPEEYKLFVRELRRIGLGATMYFAVYRVGLWLLGEQNCTAIIRVIKSMLGRTPRL